MDDLARVLRPKLFSEIVGQEIVVRIISGFILSEIYNQCIFLDGMKGCGKTSLARLIAKRLKCESPEGIEPCCKCSSCVAIENEDLGPDILEINGASERGIDNAKSIILDSIRPPWLGSHRIIIIDEVHQLTNEAQSSLLKLLEELPQHLCVILCTTDSHKVKDTILSRSLHLKIKSASNESISNLIDKAINIIGIKLDAEIIDMIVSHSSNSFRNCLKVLEKLFLYCGTENAITSEVVRDTLGIPDIIDIYRLIHAVMNNLPVPLIKTLDSIFSKDIDPKIVLNECDNVLREINYIRLGLLENQTLGSMSKSYEIDKCMTLQSNIYEACSNLDSVNFSDKRSVIEYAFLKTMRLENNK